MDPKRALTNRVFCPMPWTGLMYNFDGKVKNCIRSAGSIGNIKDTPIQEILSGEINQDTQLRMLNDQPGKDCHVCYDLERDKKSLDIVSDRIFYIRELKHVSFDTYKQGNHDLQTIDVRWSNLCNFACVYCSPDFSSRWAIEINKQKSRPSDKDLEDFKNYIFEHAAQLKHVYLAGGEPLLMKQNLELLELLQQVNPLVNLRINTNLSKVDTKIFELVCKFKNVHWTVSVDEIEKEFEYVRFGGKWQDFLDNLHIISQLSHKISFNMLYFLLNHRSLFDTVDYFLEKGYHPNSFIIGPLLTPVELNIRHLPDWEKIELAGLITDRIDANPGYLLEDSYRNLLHYIQQPFQQDLTQGFDFLRQLDQRRGTRSEEIFPSLYKFKEN
jgi:uncharacterized Fe-S cluster-containing radical SAM superfamily protein